MFRFIDTQWHYGAVVLLYVLYGPWSVVSNAAIKSSRQS